MRTIYLAGPINKCSDKEANDWREAVMKALKGEFEFLNPMVRDYRGVEFEGKNVSKLVKDDKHDILEAEIILVNANKASWGTAMEIHFAYQNQKVIVAFTSEIRPSPWLVYHCTEVLPSLAAALEYLRMEWK